MHEVNLKWSAWTTDISIWTYRAPKAWAAISKLPIGGYVEIHSSPSKECRGLNVCIERTGKRAYTANGSVYCMWDEAYELEGTLGLLTDEGEPELFEKALAILESAGDVAMDKFIKDNGYTSLTHSQAFNDMLPYYGWGDGVGVELEFSLKARSLRALMRLIDEQENTCMEDSEAQWNDIETLFGR